MLSLSLSLSVYIYIYDLQVFAPTTQCSWGAYPQCLTQTRTRHGTQTRNWHRGKFINLFCTGSRKVSKDFFASSQMSCKHAARYFGPGLHWKGHSTEEIKQRIQSATSAWYAYKWFWPSNSSIYFKCLVFRAIFFNTLTSGLVAFAFEDSNVQMLSVCLCRFARTLSAAKARSKQ